MTSWQGEEERFWISHYQNKGLLQCVLIIYLVQYDPRVKVEDVDTLSLPGNLLHKPWICQGAELCLPFPTHVLKSLYPVP